MLVDLDGEGVVAGFEKLGDVELGGGAGVLGVADFLAVDPEVEGGVDAFEGEEGVAAVPIFGDGEVATVGADLIAIFLGEGEVVPLGNAHDAGRVFFEGIGDVGVVGGAVAVHLPVGGHGDVIPGGDIVVGFEEVDGAVVGVADVVEFPDPVEDAAEGGLEAFPGEGRLAGGEGHLGGVGGLLVDAKDGFVFPIGLSGGEGEDGECEEAEERDFHRWCRGEDGGERGCRARGKW